ncbi:KaiC domain-containing protein [Haloferax mucosum]|nr:KaiC domain-containing protein [Haloferax mucosum]
MSEDDDWFERALRERGDGDTDEDDDAAADEESDVTAESEAEGGDDADSPDGTDSAVSPSESDDDTDADSESGDRESVSGSGDGLASPDASKGESADSDPFADQPFPDGPDDSTETTDGESPGSPADDPDDDPFSMDFATAFENAPTPEMDDAGGGFGGSSSGGMGGDFALDTGDQSDSPSFDDEEFESDIARIDTGIEGLDDMILGGVPKRSLMVAIGSAGTGKTTFGLQFLRETLRDGGSGVYITLEESRERILSTADEKGWGFTEHESDGRLAIVDLDPVEMANSLSSIRNDLPRLIEDFGANRLVLDSVSLLEMMYDQPSKRRSEVFNFTRSLKEAGVTTMLTSEADQSNPYVSRHGIVEYLSDAVFVLQYIRPDDFRETRLAIEIQKIRDANHSRETKPYELTSEGISVYRQANIF